MDDALEEVAVPMIYEINIRVVLQIPENTRAESAIGATVVGKGRRYGIPLVGVTGFDIGNGQVVGQMTWADDLPPVFENK